jgi:hypothetical protein
MEPNNQFGLSSSPQSSNGAEANSLHGSPETSLSTFSDQTPIAFAEATAAPAYALTAAHFLPGFLTNPNAVLQSQNLQLGNGGQFPQSMHDPFVTNTGSLVMREQKLSPTASSFQPFSTANVSQVSLRFQEKVYFILIAERLLHLSIQLPVPEISSRLPLRLLVLGIIYH